jgi:hypothetical protein
MAQLNPQNRLTQPELFNLVNNSLPRHSWPQANEAGSLILRLAEGPKRCEPVWAGCRLRCGRWRLAPYSLQSEVCGLL